MRILKCYCTQFAKDIGGKNIAKKIVYNCKACFRDKGVVAVNGTITADRIVPKRAFFTTGVDFAEPITMLVNRGRGRKTNKSYIMLFICFTTNAIHLEAVSNLDVASFIDA